jgi:hypothetical protein
MRFRAQGGIHPGDAGTEYQQGRIFVNFFSIQQCVDQGRRTKQLVANADRPET